MESLGFVRTRRKTGARKAGSCADTLWEVNELKGHITMEARPLPRAAPATQAAMVRRARRREKEMLACVRSEEARMGQEGMSTAGIPAHLAVVMCGDLTPWTPNPKP